MNLASITYNTELGDLLNVGEARGILNDYINGVEKSVSNVTAQVMDWCNRYRESFVINDGYMLVSFFQRPVNSVHDVIDSLDGIRSDGIAKLEKRYVEEARTLKEKIQERINYLEGQIALLTTLINKLLSAKPVDLKKYNEYVKQKVSYENELKKLKEKKERVKAAINKY